jgi:hypothetical protein
MSNINESDFGHCAAENKWDAHTISCEPLSKFVLESWSNNLTT